MRKMRKGVSLCYFPKLISLNLSLKYNFGSRTRVKKEYMNEPIQDIVLFESFHGFPSKF